MMSDGDDHRHPGDGGHSAPPSAAGAWRPSPRSGWRRRRPGARSRRSWPGARAPGPPRRAARRRPRGCRRSAARIRSTAASTRLSSAITHGQHDEQQDRVADPPEDHATPRLLVCRGGRTGANTRLSAITRGPQADGEAAGRARRARPSPCPPPPADVGLHALREAPEQHARDVGDEPAPVVRRGAGDRQVLRRRSPACRRPSGRIVAVIVIVGLAAAPVLRARRLEHHPVGRLVGLDDARRAGEVQLHRAQRGARPCLGRCRRRRLRRAWRRAGTARGRARRGSTPTPGRRARRP